MNALIEKFRSLAPATAPFELRPGVSVVDPALFHAALEAEIAKGPKSARVILGALAGDLEDYFRTRIA